MRISALSFPPSLQLLKCSLIDDCGFWLPTWPEGSAEKSLLCAHSCHLTSEWGLWEALLCNPWSVWVCVSVAVSVCPWVVVHLPTGILVFVHILRGRWCFSGEHYYKEHAAHAKTTTDPSVYRRKSNTAPVHLHCSLLSNLCEEVYHSWLQTSTGAG